MNTITCNFSHPSDPTVTDRIAVVGSTWVYRDGFHGVAKAYRLESHEAARAAARRKAKALLAAGWEVSR